jgi:hypothetical protein
MLQTLESDKSKALRGSCFEQLSVALSEHIGTRLSFANDQNPHVLACLYFGTQGILAATRRS